MLKFITKEYNASTMDAPSSVPAVGNAINVQNTQKVLMDDYHGLFVGYGRRDTCYPYREQNLYSEPVKRKLNIAVLENDYLYAEFLVDYGARLWTLKNKKTGRDIIYTNDVIRFRNLSLRNCWFSGGVEWNIGIIGHTAYTAERLYTAKLKNDDGTDVLRFYEFERVREVFYQLDFWLDKDKLLVRVTIDNPNENVTPMYWWSNIATPEFRGGRLVVSADSAFSNSDGTGIKRSAFPLADGKTDFSYYENIIDTIDYFFDLHDGANKYIVNLDADGRGMLQASSSLLQGRKLFSWGHTPGSKHWQNILTDNAGDYIEIQAGLAKTQYECIPMPPKTKWEWVEVYTSIETDKKIISEPFDKLQRAVNDSVNDIASTRSLDELCARTAAMARRKADIVFAGKGFGKLKNIAENNAPAHLEFITSEESEKYEKLLTEGRYDGDISAQIQFIEEKYLVKAMETYVQSDTDNWNAYYQLSAYYAGRGEWEKARLYAEKSMTFDNNYLNNHLMAFILSNLNRKNYGYFATKAIRLCGNDYSAAESIMKMFIDREDYKSAIDLYAMLSPDIGEKPRLKMYYSMCLLKTGDADGAERVLLSDGGLELLDFREGDKFLNNLYKGIRKLKYGESPEDVTVPLQFDFVVVKDYK